MTPGPPAAAALDPAEGRIVGFLAPVGGRAGRVVIRLDGAAAAERVAIESGATLAGGPLTPPEGPCAFTARLPRRVAGRVLTVEDGAGRTFFSARFEDEAALARYREGTAMTDRIEVEGLKLENGRFRARVRAAGAAPEVALRVRGEDAGRAALTPNGEGVFNLAAPLPPAALSDGARVVEFVLADGSVAARYPVAAGEALDGDLEAEIASLRAELDLLKRAFREAMAGGVIARDERPLIVAETLALVDDLLSERDRVPASGQSGPDDDWDDEPMKWDVEE